MSGLLFAAVLLAALPGWTALPLKTGGPPQQYAHYQRTESDGTTTELIATRQNCDCEPATAARMVATAVAGRGAIVKHSTAQMCGVHAEHVVVTGLASQENHTHNIYLYFLRKGGTMYSISGYFDSGAPPAGLDTALAKLCP